MKKILKIILGIVLVLLLGFSVFLSYEINSAVTNLTSQEDTVKNTEKFLDQHDFDLEEFRSTYNYKEETIKNTVDDYDFKISTFNLDQAGDVFIFLHGMGGGGDTMDPLAKIFLDKGYSSIVYDQMNSGSHPIKKNAFGVKEKNDLISLIDYIKENYPNKKINLFAESYGASTVLQAYMDVKDKINLIILDSPMSRGEEMIDPGFKQSQEETGLPWKVAKFLGNMGSRVLEGYSYKDTNSIDKIDKITNPILIISAKDDEVTSFGQAQAVYDKASDKRELLLSKSDHAEMFFNENERYLKGIDDFLKKYD
ncbi:MAG: alpha/beta fold hydrolase [Anaerococcus sp.]|jgi:alpha-beta hydrolase superfamily lysophospholipase|nr:alpha/beta fold hydrolase [Peptoniphilaceae bacterium]MDY3054859.1 alpha/beta fold hydrolase [Anaerococcus sp.]